MSQEIPVIPHTTTVDLTMTHSQRKSPEKTPAEKKHSKYIEIIIEQTKQILYDDLLDNISSNNKIRNLEYKIQQNLETSKKRVRHLLF